MKRSRPRRSPVVSPKLTLLTILAFPVLCFAQSVAAEGVTRFDIAIKRSSDEVQVRKVESGVLLWVRSPFGISEMVVTRKEEHWPVVVKLRLQLRGLEKLQVLSGKLSLGARVNSSQASHEYDSLVGEVDYNCWKDVEKEEKRLTTNSRYWLPIKRVVSVDSESIGTSKQRDFEITLPKAVFDGNPKAITVKWIDFYR